MSIKLAIILGTYNRKKLLKKCLESLIDKVKLPHIVYVIDAGSTDGTKEYLEKIDGKIKIIEDKRRIGQAKSINKLLKKINTEYVCWLSDDNIVQKGMLNKAAEILDLNRKIGMVGLKVKDVTGPYRSEEYIGGISEAGILNVNQGMVRMNIMRKVNFFDEKFPDYGMDVDLTTKILLTGYKVVYTKDISILHYRSYHHYPGAFELEDRKKRSLLSHQIYLRKYPLLCKDYRSKTLFYYRLFLLIKSIFSIPFEIIYTLISIPLSRTRLIYILIDNKKRIIILKNKILGTRRDRNNILRGRFISYLDLWYNRNRDFYLVQKINDKAQTEINHQK